MATPPEKPLLPDRYPQQDLFICDVTDAILKDLIPMMEHPFYSLSKKPDTQIRRYEHNGNWLEIVPSVKGLATIYDKDILIYCISQLMNARKRGEKISPRIRINSRELLMFTNRGTAGPNYQALIEAIDRLAGTRISTNVKTGDEEHYDTFGLIDAASVRRKLGFSGRLLWVEIKLSDWIFKAITANEVLTLNPHYFRLKKPLERRVYELARKHCGKQKQWAISIALLLKKSGSLSPEKRFRQMIKHIVKHDHLPDYYVRYDETKDTVIFVNRKKWWDKGREPALPHFYPETYEKASRAAPRYDIYALEREWRNWCQDKAIPDSPEAAFIGFCKRKYKENPYP